MQTIEVETIVEPSPEAKELMVIVRETGVEKETADSLLECFAPMAKKEREAREKLEAENRARIAAEKAKSESEAKAKAAAERAPDKKKLESVALAYRAVQLPAMATLHGKTACDRIQRAFAAFIATVESECGTI